MASGARARLYENSPSFFTIILDNFLHTNRLLIPQDTVRRCGRSLKDDVVLKLPGSEWKMRLTRTTSEGRSRVYIDAGWVDLSRHFSICRGHLLCLRYTRDSRFDVSIYDPTTREIDYPIKSHLESENTQPPEYLASPFSKSRAKETRRTSVSQSCKRKRKEKQPMQGNDNDGGRESSDTDSQLSWEETGRALKRARRFVKSTHPSFLHVLQDSHFRAPGFLSIPYRFAESYLHLSNKKVVLIAPDKSKWLVSFTYKSVDSRPGFRKGWVAFARENDLAVGDICVFTLAKSDETTVFKVSFFCKNGDNNTHFTTDSATKQKSPAVDEQSENPSFTVYMHASYFNRCGACLRVPAGFAQAYLRKSPREICLRDSSGRSWFMEYRITLVGSQKASHKRYMFCTGWSDFRREIGLKEGDICAFELTNRKEISFDVRVVKPSHPNYEQMHIDLGPKRTKSKPSRGKKCQN